MKPNIPYPNLTERDYRKDIDGLRGLAVSSVLLYHAFPEYISGGFIGVDIFFVISGYLITLIILNNLSNGAFKFIEFYERRVVRIFPALIAVLIATYIFGFWLFFSDKFSTLAKHIAAGAGFVSNFLLLSESGYFDGSSNLKPLLHLWSLGVEEQFYIIWPLVLWLGWKLRINTFFLIACFASFSFALSIIISNIGQSLAFYFPLSRFWELALGGLLASSIINLRLRPQLFKNLFIHQMISRNSVFLRNAAAFIGIGLLIYGFLSITTKSNFPGFLAIYPVFGTILIIFAGNDAILNKYMLSNKCIVTIGLISYPLYLIHWPLLSFFSILRGSPLDWTLRAILIFLSLVLSWLVYQLIEKKVRFGSRLNRNAFISGLLMFFILLTSVWTYRTGGFKFRDATKSDEFISYFENSLPKWNYYRKEDYAKYFFNCNFYDLESHVDGRPSDVPLSEIDSSCFTRVSNTQPAVFIWGDSHAQHLRYGLEQNLPNPWQILQVTSSGCNVTLKIQQTPLCKKSNEFALNAIKLTKPNVVVIAHMDRHDVNEAVEINSILYSFGVKKVIFLGPVPMWQGNLPDIIVHKLWPQTPERTLTGLNVSVLDINNKLKSEYTSNKLHYLDVISYFCNKDGCLTRVGPDRLSGITTIDYGHFVKASSDYFAKTALVKDIVGD